MDGRKLGLKLNATGKTREQIAELLGMTGAQLERKLDMADVPTSFVEDLSAALGLPAGFFFGSEQDWRCSRVVADRGPIELPFTPLELDLPLKEGESVKYMAAAIIDECQELDAYPMERLQEFVWPTDREVVFFVFRSDNDCLIRYFSRVRGVCGHIPADDFGFCIDTESTPSLRLCLYRDRRKVAEIPVNDLDKFCDALMSLWGDYRDRLYDLHADQQSSTSGKQTL